MQLSVVEGGRGGLPPVPAAPRLVLPPDWLPVVLFAGDALIAGMAVCAAYWLRTLGYTDAAARAEQFGPYVHAVPLVMAVCAGALAINGQYRSWRASGLVEQLFRLVSGVGLAVLLLLALGAGTFTIQTYSRYAITYAAVLCVAGMAAERVLLRGLETRLRRHGIGTERVLVVGAGGTGELLIGRMRMFPQFGYTVCGVVDDSWDLATSFAGLRVVGRPADLARLVAEHAIDKCILALPANRRDRLVELIEQCREQHIEFRLVPDLLELMSTRASAESVDGLPLIGVRRRLIGSPSWAGKRLIDLSVAACALALAAPLLLAIAAAIRLTSPGGSVLAGELRIGRFGRPFTLHRFRTTAPAVPAEEGPVVALSHAAAPTELGRLLRRTGLDALPRLLNVLRGDMSLVGPRPQPAPVDDRYCSEIPRYAERRQVRPGLLGWAAANDVADVGTAFDQAMYDLYYVENWSLAMDLRIAVLSALRFVRYRPLAQ